MVDEELLFCIKAVKQTHFQLHSASSVLDMVMFSTKSIHITTWGSERGWKRGYLGRISEFSIALNSIKWINNKRKMGKKVSHASCYKGMSFSPVQPKGRIFAELRKSEPIHIIFFKWRLTALYPTAQTTSLWEEIENCPKIYLILRMFPYLNRIQKFNKLVDTYIYQQPSHWWPYVASIVQEQLHDKPTERASTFS